MENKTFRKHNPFQSKKNIVTGRNPVIEALKGTTLIDKVLLYKNATGPVIAEIRNLAADNNVPVQYVPEEKLNRLTNTNHQGVVAYKSAIKYQDLQQVIDWVNEKGEASLFLMFDGITDIRNIGAIARSAVCTATHAIIIPEKGIGALNEDAIRSSSGALEHLHVCRVANLPTAIETLHLNGIAVYTTAMKSPQKVYQMDLNKPVCIVMGGEEKGIQPAIKDAADGEFTIPMQGNFDSFNVSVAAGIILYEVMRQRTV